jgi:transposase
MRLLVEDLNPETEKMLRRIQRESRHHQVRQRAHCILLSFEGFSIEQLVKIFQVSRKTIYNWINAWLDNRLVGLYNQPGRGRKQTFTPEQKEQIKQWAKQTPKNLKRVLAQIKKHWGITVSLDTIRRILKTVLMTWRRLKRGLSGNPDQTEYTQKQQQLEDLRKLHECGEIDLRYLDETGFCLTPYIPYAWQEKGETIELKSRRSQRLNVLGLLNQDNELFAYTFEGRITSEVVISCLDKFCISLKKKTVVVMDKASFHCSNKIKDKLKEWQEKQLEIFWLPAYSPELNLIEILWRFMKYEWIEIDAYENWHSLVLYVEKVLKGFGSEYVINFA